MEKTNVKHDDLVDRQVCTLCHDFGSVWDAGYGETLPCPACNPEGTVRS